MAQQLRDPLIGDTAGTEPCRIGGAQIVTTLSTYDANGNTLTDASGKSYTWDFENRLTQVVNPGVGTTTFRYDPFGRRIPKSGLTCPQLSCTRSYDSLRLRVCG